jgi:serine/threonine-protein kinase PknG
MTGNACQRPGCTGHYDADGYCDECGHKAPPGVLAGAAAVGAPSMARPSFGVPSGPTAGFTGPTGAGLAGRSTGHSRSRSAGRGRLGANLVEVPPVPLRDPASAVLKDPKVPESQRFCGNCGEPAGRGHDGRPGRTEGFCPKCRTKYSFVPRLTPGEPVDDRYEILGALAHGGLGWIYLARDRNISDAGSDRWVVLKGLINTSDADAIAAAMAERRFLVEVDHPNIVKIHDFVEHPDPLTGEKVGYIVMEYVGGRSLKDLALGNVGPDGRRVPLPLPTVLAYGLEVLPALGYLHGRDLLFCDFKPDNVIHAEEQLKLIDLGAVRRMDDHVSALYGTPGYQAPELATLGPSVQSDVYTVGRTLAVLSFDFRGFSTQYADKLPEPADIPLLAQEESYHRFLRRATDADPNERFESAADMAEQALGVLCEVLSAADGIPRATSSTRFTPERRAFGVDEMPTGPEVAAALPLPLIDPADPGAGFVAALTGTDPATTVSELRRSPVRSPEVTLRLVRAFLEAGDVRRAVHELGGKFPDGPDWRRHWYGGLIGLAANEPKRAASDFNQVYDMLPGEPAARLALGAADELAGRRDIAARRYERVWRMDHGFVSAAFGLARCRLAAGDRAGAVAVLDEVPDSSSQHLAAQVAAVRAGLDKASGTLAEVDLVAASMRLEKLKLDAQRRATLAIELFRTALEWLGVPDGAVRSVPAPVRPPVNGKVLGQALREREIRFGLERAYRALATLEPDALARYALVDQANEVRPRTVV